MITLISASSEKVQDAFINCVKKISGRGICILLTKPAVATIDLLKRKKVDMSELLFIDMVSSQEGDEVICVRRGNLTALAITIREALSAMQVNQASVVFDCFSTLQVDVDEVTLSRFALYVFNLLREYNANGYVVVANDSAASMVYATLQQGADKVVESKKSLAKGKRVGQVV